MGNMAACLVQHRAAALPAVNTNKQRLVSLKLLMKVIHKMKKRPLGSSSSSSGKKAKQIGSKSSSSPSSTAAATVAAVADGSMKGGGVVEEKSSSSNNKAVVVSNNPKGAVLRSRLHHGRGGGGGGGIKKGAVRVKVVLTKEEAARLLSLTVGGQKNAAQIVAEIKRMEARRAAANAAWRPALASIPEESS